MRLAISTTETLTDLKMDLVVANNNNNRAHPERKQIEVRSLKRIQCDVLEADLIGVNIDRE